MRHETILNRIAHGEDVAENHIYYTRDYVAKLLKEMCTYLKAILEMEDGE